MRLTLDSLYRDHDNLRRILYLIEQLLIEFQRGPSRDLALLRRTLAYIMDYPEHVHHPSEDAIFSVLFKKGIDDPVFEKDIRSLMKDHSEIEVITKRAIETVDHAIADPEADIPELNDRISELVQRQRSHILFEEMKVYPKLAGMLDSDDWKTIGSLVPAQEDPVFGDETKREYEMIFKAL